MATNRDLLKEAIADAKTVKETAIANAKAALEESFGPFLREKLAAKLSEMEETDEELYEMEKEETKEAEEKKPMDEMGYSEEMDEEISLDELLAEISEEEQLDEAKKDESEKKSEKKEKTDEAKKAEEEVSIEDMTEDDLKSFIEGVIKDMVAAGELEAAEGGEGEEIDMNMNMEMPEEGESEEEVNIDELLAEVEKDEDMKEGYEPNTNGCPAGEGKWKDGKCYPLMQAGYQDLGEIPRLEDGHIIIPNEVWSMEEGKMKEKDIEENTEILKLSGQEYVDFCKKNPQHPGCLSETKKMEKELQELRSELQEINLLNAKLLYTNKLFRNKSLSESQKVKVLAAFDKAKTKQEAQLIYETLLGSVATTAKSSIKESLGSASKALGNATKPIIENDAFARMRELAGLKK